MQTNQITNQDFIIPEKAIVCNVVFIDGSASKIVTAIPKGIFYDHIRIGIINSLAMQNNVVSCDCGLYEKVNGEVILTIGFSTYFFDDQNRIENPHINEYEHAPSYCFKNPRNEIMRHYKSAV